MAVAAWILFTLEALFVLMLAVTKNMGDDAAGRGLATGWALILAVPLLLAGGLLAWGTWGHQKPAFWVGFALVASPVAFGAFGAGTGLLKKVNRAMGKAQYGRFADASLTRVARAIDHNDTTRVAALLAAGRPDFAARDRCGHTLLGHAVYRVVEDFYENRRAGCVRLLLAAGAPPAVDALAAERTMASISDHDLVYHLFAVQTPGALEVLDMLLEAGASPNTVDEDDRPIIFSTYARRPGLAVLARHGGDMRALDTREDRLKWTALMNAAYVQAWDAALFFHEQGVPADYVAPDGASLATILAEVDPPGSSYSEADRVAHDALMARLTR